MIDPNSEHFHIYQEAHRSPAQRGERENQSCQDGEHDSQREMQENARQTEWSPPAVSALLTGDYTNAFLALTPGGIEAQEAAAQREVSFGKKLPKEGTTTSSSYRFSETNQARLEALGFVFGADIDDLFVACQLPQGWKIIPTEHSMWSVMLDDWGRERARLFYKGAFYDRRADLRMNQRYTIKEWYAASPAEPSIHESSAWYCLTVQDWDATVLYHTGPYAQRDLDAYAASYAACKTWLAEHYPLYQDVFAYWDK